MISFRWVHLAAALILIALGGVISRGLAQAPDVTCDDAAATAGTWDQGFVLAPLPRDGTARPLSTLDLVSVAPAATAGLEEVDDVGARGPDACVTGDCPSRDGGAALLSELLASGPRRIADNFNSGSITSATGLCFYGVYGDNNAPGPETFIITVYRDNAGVPGTIQAQRTVVRNQTLTRTQTGQLLNGVLLEYRYSVVFTNPIVLTANTCYWIEIVSDGNTTGGWFWEQTSTGQHADGRYMSVHSSTAPYQAYHAVNDAAGNDMVWCFQAARGTGTCPAVSASVACTSNDVVNCQERVQTGINYFASDDVATTATSRQLVADDFSVGAAGGTLSQVCWWGAYFSVAEPPAASTDNFVIMVYQNDGGAPGAVVAALTQGVDFTVSRGWSGDNPRVFTSGTTVYNLVWTANISPAGGPISLDPNTCYWISIVNNTSAALWGWRISSAGNSVVAIDGGMNTIPDGFRVGDRVVGVADVSFCVSTAIEGGFGCDADAPPPPNDDCFAATTLALNAPPVTGTTIGAMPTPVPLAPPCGPVTTGYRDVWYKVTSPVTQRLTASMCFPRTDYDALLSVYCPIGAGPCAGGLACVTGTDDSPGCGLAPTATWVATAGTTYYLRVTGGLVNGVGNFDIAVTSVPSQEAPAACTPCDVTSTGATHFEAETCPMLINGSCGTAANQVLPIPAKLFATAWADAGTFEYDSFGFNLTGTRAVDLTIETEFPLIVEIWDDRDACGSTQTLVRSVAQTCQPTSLSVQLPAGQYWLRTRLDDSVGAPCATFNDYTIALSSTPVGRCCLPDGTCQSLAPFVCASRDGVYGGDGTTCDGSCPVTRGACCLPGGTCYDAPTEAACISLLGVFHGTGTTCTMLTPTIRNYNASPNIIITDGDPSGIFHNINVPESYMVGDVVVGVSIPDHTFISDLVIQLEHGGESAYLWFGECFDPPTGSSQTGLTATFSDAGGPIVCASPTTGTFQPLNDLSVFDGLPANGPWTLRVTDSILSDFGTLVSWSLVLREQVNSFDCSRACPCQYDQADPQINVFDLLAYLAVWFPANGQPTVPGGGADLTADGQVDVFDLLEFLTCWFPANGGQLCG